MKKPTKTKAVKAVKYWAAPDSINLYRSRKEARYFSGFYAPKVKPVVLVPVDAKSVDAIVEQMAKAMHEENKFYQWGDMEKFARASLAAIGIKGGAK